MKHLNKLILWIGFILSGVFLSAQSSDSFSDISYLTSDNGLSQSEVTCIIQDQQGFLWIGTRGGLNRYDGYQFKVFKNEIGSANSLINNSIESLFEDSNGKIWVGTKSGGVSCYDPKFDQFQHFQADHSDPSSLSGNRIISIAEGNDGKIWLGTWTNGFNIFDPKSQSFTQRLGKRRISDILPAEDGNMWISGRGGLYLFDQQGQQLKHFRHVAQPDVYNSILKDTNGENLWIGTWQKGLLQFNIRTETFRQHRHEVQQSYNARANIVYSLFQDSKGQIWTGTWGGGLHIFNLETNTFKHHELATGRFQNAQNIYSDILSIFQDRSGIIWIGTNGGGLCKINQSNDHFSLLKGGSKNKNKLPSSNPVWSILEDQSGIFWVGTKSNGYLSYSVDGSSFKTLEFPEFRAAANGSKRILGGKVLFQRRDESLWVGTHHGLYQVIRSGEQPIRLEKSYTAAQEQGVVIKGVKVSSIEETTDGSFWIGTQQSGLNRIVPTKDPKGEMLLHYDAGQTPGTLRNRRISSLLEDQAQRLWVGTYGGLHLYLPKEGRFQVFTKVPGDLKSLSSNIIICLYEDRQKRLWIGTPNGLNLAVPGPNDTLVFQSFQEKDGLPNNYIHGILEDDAGKLWISTNKGISKFDPDRKVFYNYDVNDGLQGNSFSEGAACKSKDGHLYFGGIYGLNYFHPDSIRLNPVPPPVFITGFKIFNQEVGVKETFDERIILEQALFQTEKITLSHRENVFSLEFTALDFRAPHKNIYRYRLLGLEEDWNEAGGRRNVTYTNLRPGTYTFEVNASNNHQVWNEQVARLQILVLPPFWATWQAYLVYILLLFGLFGVYHRITSTQNQLKSKLAMARLEQKKDAEVTELKTRFFTNITHELRTPLTLISGPVEELLDQQTIAGQARQYLVNVHHHTQRLLALVNQLLDFRKAESGNMELNAARGNFVVFAKEVFLSFQPMAHKKNIVFHFDTHPEEIELYFDRDKMEIVLCNLLSNAFKYTPEGRQISVSIRQGTCSEEISDDRFPEGCCKISIKDNGIGMPKDLVEKIFNRFYQITNADSVKMIGTGIGLSLVENIVQLHQGRVEVQAELGKGSEFVVHLPIGCQHLSNDQIITDFQNSESRSHYLAEPKSIEATAEMTTAIKVTELPSHPPIRLLLVEDNPRIRNFIRSIFADHYHILEAENGKEGLQIAKQEVPDLIVSDVMMPEMDGINFCKHIKEDQNTSHIPVILLTARTSTVFQVEGFHSGADAYITKPFQPTVLKAQVASILDTRLRLREYFSRKVTLQPSDIEITSEDEEFLKKAIQVIEENLNNENLGKDFLAQAMAMSPSSLYRKVKSITDLSINAFIRSIRLRRAAQLILHTQYNISEVSYQVGFNDLKYFRKCFREQFGKNPSEYTQKQLHTSSLGE